MMDEGLLMTDDDLLMMDDKIIGDFKFSTFP
jgi:hypothetical protein